MIGSEFSLKPNNIAFCPRCALSAVRICAIGEELEEGLGEK